MEVQLDPGRSRPPNPLLFIPGFLLVGLGLLIIWNPDLLHYFLGGAFIALGVLLTLLLLALRRALARGAFRGFGPGGFGGGNPFGQP